MNRISVQGTTGIIRDIAARFLRGQRSRVPAGEGIRGAYGEAIRALARERSVDIEDLERIVEYLVCHGAPQERIGSLLTNRQDDLVGLLNDVRILERYSGDDTIRSVRVIEERSPGTPGWPAE